MISQWNQSTNLYNQSIITIFLLFSLLCISIGPRSIGFSLHFLLYFQLIAITIQELPFNIKITSLFIPRYYQYILSMGKKQKNMTRKGKKSKERSQSSSDNEVKQLKKRFITEKYSLKKRICLKNSCDVLKATTNCKEKKEVIIKVMMSTVKIQHIVKEITISKQIRVPECSSLIDAFESQNHVCLVTNYIKSTPFHKIVEYANTNLLRAYMTSLFKSVKALKDYEIVHRDIKPDNFLFDIDKREGQLIDFGLAQFEKECKLGFYGTQGYQPLQVALNVQSWSYSSQMWSVGVIMLHIMTGKHKIFHECIAKKGNKQITCSKETKRQNYICSFILELSIIFGKAQVIKQCKNFSYKLTLPSRLKENLIDKLILPKYGNEEKDLLKKLLDLDPQKRITVEQALMHPFITK